LGITFQPEAFSVKDIIRFTKKAESKGYESVWVPEHYLFRDAFSTLGTLASVTEKIKLATGVVNPYTRHPALIAMSIATLDEISDGRAILGIGTGVPYWIEQLMAIKMEKPILAMREAVYIIRKLLSGENVDYNGKVFALKNMRLGFKTPQTHIPIYIAAVGPEMQQLAGNIADGVILTAGCSLNYVLRTIKNIKLGAERVGRKLSQIDVAAFLICSVSEDSSTAKNATRELVAFLLSRPGRAEAMLEKDIYDQKLLKLIRQHVQKGDLKKAGAYLTEAMIDAVTIAGTPQECKKKIQEFKRANITLPILSIVKQAKEDALIDFLDKLL
jgi:5,10-methylenetetrahydromethanopterin reductase